MDNPNIPDCTSCKLVGAGGCFAGAVYALYERSKIPTGGKNRAWLTVIGVGEYLNIIIQQPTLFKFNSKQNVFPQHPMITK